MNMQTFSSSTEDVMVIQGLMLNNTDDYRMREFQRKQFLALFLEFSVFKIHSPAPRCGTIASVAFILWRVKQAANKLCWLAYMCKYNTQGSYSYNHCSGQRGSTIDH
jgi:hypothetical protein